MREVIDFRREPETLEIVWPASPELGLRVLFCMLQMDTSAWLLINALLRCS